MSNSESDSDSSGWTLLSREGLDEECVAAEQRATFRHSDSEEDGAETVPPGAAQSQDNGGQSGADDIGSKRTCSPPSNRFLEGKLQEVSEARGKAVKGSGETGLHHEATCTEEVKEETGDEMKQEARDVDDEVEEADGEVSKTSEAGDEVVDRVEEEVGDVGEEVMPGEELSVEVRSIMTEEMREVVNEEVKGQVIENVDQVPSEEVEEGVSGKVGEEILGARKEMSGDAEVTLIEVDEKMEAVSVKLSHMVMEEVRGGACKVMEEMGEEMMEASEEVSGSDDSDLVTLDPSALDETPDPGAPSEAPAEAPDSADPSPSLGSEEDPPRPASLHSETTEAGGRAVGEDALAGSSSLGSHLPFPLARERAPSSAGSSTDEEDEKTLDRCDGDEVRKGPPAPRLRRRLGRRQFSSPPADDAVPDTEGTALGTGVPLTVLVPALALALIVALGLVVASNHVASRRQAVLVQENEQLRAAKHQLQAKASIVAARWEAERGALSQENAALRAALARPREEAGPPATVAGQEAPGAGTAGQEAPGAAAARGQEAARAAARELAAEGRRLQAEVRRLHRELREERAASGAVRDERDRAAAALEAERQRSHLWERLYVEARDAAAEHGKIKKAEGARVPDARRSPDQDAKNATGRHGERGPGREAPDANRGRGWGGHATSGARSEARAEARYGDGRRGQGQGGGRRGEERLKMKGRDWRGPEEYGTQSASSAQGQGRSTKHNEQHNRCHEQHKHQQQQSYRAWHGKPRRHCDLHVAEVEIELGPLPFGPKY